VLDAILRRRHGCVEELESKLRGDLGDRAVRSDLYIGKQRSEGVGRMWVRSKAFGSYGGASTGSMR
jgi:hypothetical protein